MLVSPCLLRRLLSAVWCVRGFPVELLCVTWSAPAQNPATNVTIDANASAALLADLNAPLNRTGGNNSSRYNLLLNADNKDFDYFFQSIGDNSNAAGERTDTIFSDSKGAGAAAMLTIPMGG